MNIDYCLEKLKKSTFRARFRLKNKEILYIDEKGMQKIRQHAIDFINTRLAPAQPKNDGSQTPMKGHPVFIAQHATATCCRSCMEKWWKIQKNKPLSEEEKQFVLNLIMTWIERQYEDVKST